MRRNKLAAQVQKALAGPPSRPLPEDPFEGFREPMFDTPLPYEGERKRKLAALVQAAHELHGRKDGYVDCPFCGWQLICTVEAGICDTCGNDPSWDGPKVEG